MAPIALYPDPLLVAVLQASVVPVDVIAAAQFLDAYETDKSLQPDPTWDPAVIGLLGFPTVLRAMAANMDWVEAAGDAVLKNLAGVQQSVQQDRAEFYAAGVLKSDDKQNVIVEADLIRIEPVDPEVIYLPFYDSAALVEAIRAGDAGLAAQPAPMATADADEPADTAAQAETAARAASDAAAAAQRAATEAQAAAEQSASSASQAAQAVEAAPQPAEVAAAPVVEPAPTTYAAAPAPYAAPVTYAPPVSYADSSWSGSTWSTVGTFAGGALVGGLLGYALGDDDDNGDNDGWWDDDDDINIDEDDLDNYLDDRAQEREDARDDWQGFAEEAREDRQTAASERQGTRQEGSADRQESRTASQQQRQEAGAGRRDERAATQDQRRQDSQGAREDRQASRDTSRDDRQTSRGETLSQQRTKDAQARLDQRAQKPRQPLSAREATRAPSPVGATTRSAQTAKRTPQLDTTGAGRKASGVQATQPRQQAKVGSRATKPSSAIGGPQRGQTAKKEQARGATSRQQAAQRPAPQRQATRASAPSRQAARSSGPSRQASRPAQRKAVKPSGGNRASAQGNRGKRSRGR